MLKCNDLFAFLNESVNFHSWMRNVRWLYSASQSSVRSFGHKPITITILSIGHFLLVYIVSVQSLISFFSPFRIYSCSFVTAFILSIFISVFIWHSALWECTFVAVQRKWVVGQIPRNLFRFVYIKYAHMLSERETSHIIISMASCCLRFGCCFCCLLHCCVYVIWGFCHGNMRSS